MGAVTEVARKTTVQSLERGLEILTAIGRSAEPLGITELARQFGLAKGSVSRIVEALHNQAFVVRDPVTAKYRVSMKVWELGSGALAKLDVRQLARPVMVALNSATGETVHLTVLTESDRMVFLEKLDSTHAVRPHVELGAPHPTYCTANGKAMLAFLPKARVAAMLRGRLERHTPATIVSKSELLAQLDTFRELGYAVNRGELRADVSGIAAPIFDHAGVAVAALGVSVPSTRLTAALIADLAPRLVEGARQVSRALGYAPPAPAAVTRAPGGADRSRAGAARASP